MKKNPLLFIWGIFAILGIVFIIIGLVAGNIVSIKKENRVKTQAIITEIDRKRDADGDTSYNVWVQYEVQGKLYEEELGAYSSTYSEGKEIEVVYDKTDPHKVRAEFESWLFILIFSGLGSVFAIIGIIGLIVVLAKNAKKKEVEKTGSIIYATYLDVEMNTAIAINGKHPFNIICSWLNPEDNKTYIFKSEDLYYNPKSLITNMNLTTFPVFVNMENKKNYSVDISAIKQAVVDLR